MPSRRSAALAAVAFAAVLALAGCRDSHPAVTYDLRQPPTRAAVKMPKGERVVIDEHRVDYPVMLLLPGGVRLKTKVSLVTFDSYAAAAEGPEANPTGADMHTSRMPLDEAADVMTDTLRQLGKPDTPTREWVEEAESATGGNDIRSANVAVRLGYLSVRVQGRYNPLDEKASVAYIMFWGLDGGARLTTEATPDQSCQ